MEVLTVVEVEVRPPLTSVCSSQSRRASPLNLFLLYPSLKYSQKHRFLKVSSLDVKCFFFESTTISGSNET